MRILRPWRPVLSALVLLSVLSAHAGVAYAQQFYSDSFLVNEPHTDTFGGNGTSSSFSNVQSGGQTVTGEATSTSFLLRMGFLYFDEFAPKSQNWRWYDDAENATPSNPLANENTAPTNIGESNAIKLRIAVAETAGVGASNVKFRLQYSTTSNFTSGGYTVAEGGSCTGSSIWCYASGGGSDGAIINSTVLTDPDSCVGGVGYGCGTHNESGTTTSSLTHVPSAITEYEFTVQASGALINTTYFFRLVYVAASTTVPTNTGETYPSLVTGGSSLTFTIGGLDAGTVTDGVTTDATTTPTTVPFGRLLSNSAVEAAHRFTVSTNATNGYKIFAVQRQGFLANNGGEIAPVDATNESPASWGTSCDITAAGCFGYHTGEDILDGGSTRFAANDTFAQFTSTPKEIAYAAGPVNDRTTDIVYKVEARSLQDSGEYSTNLVFIVTPVF